MTAPNGSHQLLGSLYEGMRFCFRVSEATADESVAALAKIDTTIMSLWHQGFFLRRDYQDGGLSFSSFSLATSESLAKESVWNTST
jgi:hypothetical protein